MNRIQTIIDKEWAEVFKNRLVIFTVVLLPVIFTVLPLVVLSVTRSSGGSGSSSTDMPAAFAAACSNLPTSDCLQIYLVDEFLLLYMMVPVIVPITIAAYSIVGEKTTRSLEPLLATPISTIELLTGKSIAAAVPAILATWASFAVFVLLAPLVGASRGVVAYILSPTWLLAVIVAGPLMAILSVNFALFVSSRVNDPRVAEQISARAHPADLAVIFWTDCRLRRPEPGHHAAVHCRPGGGRCGHDLHWGAPVPTRNHLDALEIK